MRRLEHWVERALWGSRLVVIVAVVMSTLVALSVLLLATVDTLYVLQRVWAYVGLAPELRSAERVTIITYVVKTVDSYLITAILLIFAFGLYELFIGQLDIARSSDAAHLLRIRSFDHLKDRVAKMILLVLIVEFFQYALRLLYTTALELLYLATGILMIGGALYLTKDRKSDGTTPPGNAYSATYGANGSVAGTNHSVISAGNAPASSTSD